MANEFAEKSFQDIEDTSILVPKKAKKPSAMAHSMIVDPSTSPPIGTPSRRSSVRPNSLVLNKHKMKENFKGDSVTVVRTHTIESFNCTVSSYIRAFVSPDRSSLKFELSAYLNEESSAGGNKLSRMKMDKVEIEEKEFFQILVGCEQSHLNLSPNFLLVNEHVDWLLKLLVVRFLDVEVDSQASIIRPLITSKPTVLAQSSSLECMGSQFTASLVHNQGNGFWIGFSSLSSHK
jgi:hypothetical protein